MGFGRGGTSLQPEFQSFAVLLWDIFGFGREDAGMTAIHRVLFLNETQPSSVFLLPPLSQSLAPARV